MRPLSISLEDARSLALEAQGLAESQPFGLGKQGVLKAIEHLGYVQIDTISVVERAHHHVLWSRVPDYSVNQLHDLMTKDRTVFEYWSHAAAFLPMRDFRFSLPRKRDFAEGRRHWFRRNKKTMKYVLDRVRAEGPLQARDFENPRRRGTWWDWKPAKIALEQLFQEGTLMIRERRGFQKVYDLPERVLPAGIDDRFPEPEEFALHLILSGLRAHGIASARELGYLRRGMGRAVDRALKKALAEGQVLAARVEGIDEPHFVLSEPKPRGPEASLRILSPFDSFVIQRRRVQKLFDYDYQIECYLPEGKRRFGYFCLPILWNGQPIGRIDAKADRQKSVLEVRRAYLETRGVKKNALAEPFDQAVWSFAAFNGCEQVKHARWTAR
jgi:uncharacterized protein YcaQ